jgi:hypothetical protein
MSVQYRKKKFLSKEEYGKQSRTMCVKMPLHKASRSSSAVFKEAVWEIVWSR